MQPMVYSFALDFPSPTGRPLNMSKERWQEYFQESVIPLQLTLAPEFSKLKKYSKTSAQKHHK